MSCPCDLYSIYRKMNVLNISPKELIDNISVLFDDKTLDQIYCEIYEKIYIGVQRFHFLLPGALCALYTFYHRDGADIVK